MVSYDDPGVTPERMEKFKELYRAICVEKVVILRRSEKPTKVGGGNEHREYVSMWEVADAELTDTNLTFRYVRKIDDHY